MANLQWRRELPKMVARVAGTHLRKPGGTHHGCVLCHQGQFVAEKERQWSPKSLVNLVGSVRNFDLSPDGKRIAALMPADKAEDPGVASHVTFLLNLFDELERRVPVKK